MKSLLIGILALGSPSAFASIDDLLKSLPAAIYQPYVAWAEKVILENPKAHLHWDLGMAEHQRIAFMRKYKKNVESRLDKECLPLANINYSTPIGSTVDKILMNTQKLCD